VHSTRTTSRPSRGVLALAVAGFAVVTGVLAPGTAAADPRTAADASALARETAQQLTVINEQLLQAEQTVQAQQAAAAVAAEHAATAKAAMVIYEPQLRAIAHSGYTSNSRSRVAAFLTSGSAGQLVQRMATLDVIAERTNAFIAEAAAAQQAAQQAQAAADEAAATAQAGRDQLAAQKADVKKKVEDYQADFARLSAAEQTALTTAVAGRSLAAPRDLPVPSGAAGVAIRTALAQVGDRYVGGASGPDAFDCSGLTSYAYTAAGVTLPRTSADQSRIGTQVSRAELQPGDLVFYYSPISHVALYIGDGMIVHARTETSPVAVTSVDQRGFRFGVRLAG
jgi:cell wall-associated NlpC family hydrolase